MASYVMLIVMANFLDQLRQNIKDVFKREGKGRF